MVKKIKFALLMKNGAKVRTLEELRNNFDLETCISYFIDGKLQKWLEDRYYDDEAQALQTLDVTQLDIPAFCRILGVSDQPDMAVDVQTICQKNEKLDALKQLTDDEGILSHADETAFSQDELEALLAEGKSTIYLCGKQFTVSLEWTNRHYIGIIYTPDITIQANSPTDLTERHITFKNVKLPSQLLLRPVPEAHRYLQITDDCRLDKKVLADQALYPGDTWKDFLYILFQHKYYSVEAVFGTQKTKLIPSTWDDFFDSVEAVFGTQKTKKIPSTWDDFLDSVEAVFGTQKTKKIPSTWDDFLALDDMNTAKTLTDEEETPYKGKYITGYTWYDVTYEIMKYFMKKEPCVWKQRISRKNYMENWGVYGVNSIRERMKQKMQQNILNETERLLWALYAFCEVDSRIYHKQSWLDSTIKKSSFTRIMLASESVTNIFRHCYLSAKEAEANGFDNWDRKLIDYVATEVCKEVKKIKK